MSTSNQCTMKNLLKITSSIIPFILVLTSIGVNALEPVAKIIKQENAPIRLQSYEAKYKEGGSYTREGIYHSVNYVNTSDQEIVAIQITFVSFDVWNELLDRTGGFALNNLSPEEKEEGSWVVTAYADSSFYTGVAYVSKVRFASGEIWEVNYDRILQELKQIESDLTREQLTNDQEK